MNYKTFWITISDYAIAFGVVFDMVIQPLSSLFIEIEPIPYSDLAILLGTVLGIRGAREIGLNGFGKKKSSEDTQY